MQYLQVCCSTQHLCWSLFLIKLQAFRSAKFLRTAFFIEHLRWLLLPLMKQRSTSIFCTSLQSLKNVMNTLLGLLYNNFWNSIETAATCRNTVSSDCFILSHCTLNDFIEWWHLKKIFNLRKILVCLQFFDYRKSILMLERKKRTKRGIKFQVITE